MLLFHFILFVCQRLEDFNFNATAFELNCNTLPKIYVLKRWSEKKGKSLQASVTQKKGKNTWISPVTLTVEPCWNSSLISPVTLTVEPCWNSSLISPVTLTVEPCWNSSLISPVTLTVEPCWNSSLISPVTLTVKPYWNSSLISPVTLTLQWNPVEIPVSLVLLR